MISSPMLEFNPLGRNRKSLNRAAVTGMTMTIYDTRFNVTNDVLEALGNPDRISIAFESDLGDFMICADPEGLRARKGASSSKQFSVKEVRDILQKQCGCDFAENFYRITNGQLHRKYVLFNIDTNLVAVKREVRNGNN